MSALPPIGCQQFDERADDLALGLVDEPERSQLLAHAAGCTACQALLDGLGTVVDRLLLTAPQVEPPAGFESRALARFAAVPAARRRVRAPLWAVACIALVVGAFGFVLAGVLDGGPNADAGATRRHRVGQRCRGGCDPAGRRATAARAHHLPEPEPEPGRAPLRAAARRRFVGGDRHVGAARRRAGCLGGRRHRGAAHGHCDAGHQRRRRDPGHRLVRLTRARGACRGGESSRPGGHSHR